MDFHLNDCQKIHQCMIANRILLFHRHHCLVFEALILYSLCIVDEIGKYLYIWVDLKSFVCTEKEKLKQNANYCLVSSTCLTQINPEIYSLFGFVSMQKENTYICIYLLRHIDIDMF